MSITDRGKRYIMNQNDRMEVDDKCHKTIFASGCVVHQTSHFFIYGYYGKSENGKVNNFVSYIVKV